MLKRIFINLIIFLSLILTVDVLAITISNPNGSAAISGYTSSNVNNYIGISTNVIQATSSSDNYYCLEPGVNHPLKTANNEWGGTATCVATSTVYENSDSNYAACAQEATTGFGSNSYANIQLHLWQALEKNISLLSYCDNEYNYFLTVYTCTPNNNTFLTGNTQKIGSFSKVLKDQKGTLKIQKICDTGVTGDFTFSIHNADESITTTVSCGNVKTISLTPGNYTIDEEQKNGITVSPSFSQNVTIIADQITNISFTNTLNPNSEPTGSIKIVKTNGSTGDPLANVIFRLVKVVGSIEYDAISAIDGRVIGNLTTNANGIIIASNLAYGTYRIKEVSSSLSGFVAMKPIEVIINANNINATVPIENNPIRVLVKKTNIDGTINLDGAQFLIKDKVTGSTIGQKTITTVNKYFNFEPGEYVITEVAAPNGYENLDVNFSLKVASDGTITLTSDNDYVTLEKETDEYALIIKNDVEKVAFYKKDISNNKELAGAKFKLSTAMGTVILEWTTTTTPIRIELDEGAYVLEEIMAPNGYTKINKKLNFNVLADGTVNSTDADLNLFVIDGRKIIVYNTKPIIIPDTGTGLKIALLISGIALICFGGYLVYKKNKEVI